MDIRSNEDFRRKSGRLFKRRIAAFSAAIMAAICALVTKAVLSEREAALHQARTEAANLSASLQEQLRGMLNGVAGAMAFVKSRIESEGPAIDLDALKASEPGLAGAAIEILVLDREGKVRASTLKGQSGPVYLSDREYFNAHLNNPGLGFFIGEPVYGKTSGRLAVPATGRLNTPDGRFAGVLNFSLDPELLTALSRKVQLGQTASTEIVRGDGSIVARYTPVKGLDKSSMGKKAVEFEAAARARAAEAGTYSARSSIDGVTRLYHWRKVPGYPLYVVAGLGKAEALASAHMQARITVGLGIAALSLPLLMMFMLNREISRRVEHAVALDRESEKVHMEHAALHAITEELAKERIKLRRFNKELALARHRAEDANRAKSAFLANMSHELRTPLNAILGFSEIIRDRLFGDDAARYAEYAADIHRSGTHLLNIVNDVLDVTRIEAGKFELREEPLKLAGILEESLLAVEPQAAKGGISLMRIAPDSGATISGDRTRLTQIFINLLSNAIKFTPAGGSVALIASPDEGGGLILTVRDTGIGMAGNEIRDAVELFRQVDSSLSRRYEGTGLGLPLAIQLTELHGGTLTVESAQGRGTAVTVRLPKERVVWEAGRPPEQAAA